VTADRFHGTLPAVLIDSINKSFFHSRMLRAWGHAKAMESNDHWMLQMRQTSSLVEAMVACGIRLDDKPASDLVIGRDSMTVLAADAAQAEHCAATASAAARTLSNGAMQSLMNEIARCTPCDFGRGAKIVTSAMSDSVRPASRNRRGM